LNRKLASANAKLSRAVPETPTDSSFFVAVIEDDPTVVRALTLMVGRSRTRVGRSVEEGKALVLSPQCVGILVDFGLPDGSGTAVVEHAQSNGRWLPVMFLTGRADYSASHQVAELGAQFVMKPPSKHILIDFVDSALSMHDTHRAVRDRISREWGHRYQLTQTERTLLDAIVHGASRGDLEHPSRSAATTKSHVRGLLQKTGDSNVEELGRRTADEALALVFADRGLLVSQRRGRPK
jgi:FixJ family two-component response regulator